MADKITLSDLKDEIVKGNKAQSNTTDAIMKLNSTFAKQFKLQARGAGDRLEDKLEGPKAPKVVKKEMTGFKPLDNASGNINAFFGRLANIGKMLAGFTAGLAAVAAAFAGMRGWELPIIKRISNIKFGNLFPESLAKTLNQKFLNVRARVLRFFSMSAVLPKGEDGKQITSIGGQIANAFKNAKASILKGFGIGIDGKLIALQGEDGKFKSPRIGKFLIQMKSLFSPITKVGAAIGEFFTGGFGSKIVTFMKGGATKLLAVFGKILWPIGVLVSAFKGVTDFIGTEGTLFEKFTAGISTALSDFIGAPLNLLKDLMAWGLKKLGFDEGAEWLKGIDFVKPIKDMITSVMEWFGTLFTDPVTALKQLWTGALNLLVAGATTLTDIFYYPINKAIEWIGSMFGWKTTDEEGKQFKLQTFIGDAISGVVTWVKGVFANPVASLKALWTTLLDGVASIGAWIYDNAIKPVFDYFTGIFKWSVDGVTKFTDSIGMIVGFAVSDAWKYVKKLFVFDKGMEGIIASLINVTTIVPNLVKDAILSITSWLAGKLGFKEEAEELSKWKDYSIGDLAVMAFNGVKNWLSSKFSGEVNLGGLSFSLSDIVTALGDNIGLMKDILVAQISFSVKRLVNGFKSGFEKAANFIANLGDELYLMISKNFRFKLPKIDIPETFITPAFNLIPAIDVGVGDATTRAAAQTRIDNRNTSSQKKIRQLDNETRRELENVQVLQAQLASNISSVIVNNNTTNTANNNSSSANSTNLNGTASAGDPFALMPGAF
tara:strand:- start:8168 stop:10489 length:2322 start_codon:yes stop_codon:yes gene_type:complete